MKTIALTLAAAAFATSALAQTTVITREAPSSETTVVRKDSLDGTTVTKKTESTGSVGCETKSVTKTNDGGDRVSKTRTEC